MKRKCVGCGQARFEVLGLETELTYENKDSVKYWDCPECGIRHTKF